MIHRHPVCSSAPAAWARRAAYRLIVLVFLGFAATSAHAESGSAGSNWKYHDIFSACRGDCGVLVYFGASFTQSALRRVAFEAATPKFDDTYFISVSALRPIVTYSDWFSIEPELGAGQRIGNMHEQEIWAALYFRAKLFPNNRYLLVSAALSGGFSYATGLSKLEIRRSKGRPSRWLHNFSPEITFALPNFPQRELVFRVQHRSGAFGLFNQGGGTNFLGTGIRFKF